jgi:exopolysaccharide production protein ExoQ
MAGASMKPASPYDQLPFMNRDLLVFVLFVLQFAPGAIGYVTTTRATAVDYTGTSLDNAETAGSILWQVTLLITFANSLLLASVFRIPLRSFALALGPILPLVVWSLMSIVWSDQPDLTVRRSVRMALELVTLACLGLMYRSPDRLLVVLFRLCLFVLALDVIFIVIPPAADVPPGYAGVHGHKNSAGQFHFIAFPVLVMGLIDRRICRSKAVAIFALIVTIALLMFSRSKTSIGVLILTVPLVLLIDRLAARNIYAVILTPFVCLVLGATFVLLVYQMGLAGLLDYVFGDANLTGRQQIWNYVYARTHTVPWHGVGFGALWQTGPNIVEHLKAYQVNIVINQAHNGYLDLSAQLGWIGLWMLLFYLAVTFIKILRAVWSHDDQRRFGFAHVALFWFCGALIYNITETSYFRSLSIWFIVFLGGVVCDYCRKQRARSVRPVVGLARAQRPPNIVASLSPPDPEPSSPKAR